MDIDEKMMQLSTYGRILSGDEDELTLAKLERISYLKNKMRKFLEWDMGDFGDNITDILRCVVLAEAIRSGLVDDTNVIQRFNEYIGEMLVGYGGAEAIMMILEKNISFLKLWLVSEYYTAKMSILSCETVDDVRAIDIDDQSVPT